MKKKYRELAPGIGEAVAKRSFLRDNETWGDVAKRVALGNTLLHPSGAQDREPLEKAIAQGGILMSGRHLQHGDANQPSLNADRFTNCSMAGTVSMMTYLLLNGSGVGSNYSDELVVLNWNHAPRVWVALDHNHPDNKGRYKNLREVAKGLAGIKTVIQHTVGDSREGWAAAVQAVEDIAWLRQQRKTDITDIVLEFSQVRCEGTPIAGMQNRPASGPAPLMDAFMGINDVVAGGYEPWNAMMRIAHNFAASVLYGGVRRCLPAGTMVHLIDGSDKPIEDIVVGDVVDTILFNAPVTATFKQGLQPVISINHEYGAFKCTRNHKVMRYLNGQFDFVEAQHLTNEDSLVIDPITWNGEHYFESGDVSYDEHRLVVTSKVLSITDNKEIVETYDIEVDDIHMFSADGVIVHNSARIAIKWWGDKGIFDFIDIKHGGGLWSANNSIGVDEEFWRLVHAQDEHALAVFNAATKAAFEHKTGEPGFINLDKLVVNMDGYKEMIEA